MKSMKTLLLALSLLPNLLRPAAAAPAAPGADELAGEQEAIKAPASKPESMEPEGAGQISLTRSMQGAGAPSFELPEAVVTGTGERKSIAARPELSVMMDTSGGIKASPGELNASKNQLGTQGARQSFENVTQSSRPAYGQLRALYGWDNTFEGDAFWGQELGKSYYLLEGSHDFSDGGSLPKGYQALNQSSQSSLLARGGWRSDGGQQFSGELSGRWRDRLWTLDPSSSPWIRRSLDEAQLSYDSAPESSWRDSLKLWGSEGDVILPGFGGAYTEGQLGLSGDLEKELFTSQSRTLISGSFHVAQLDQNHGARLAWLSGGWLQFGLEPWSGARLGLGLSLDSVSDQSDSFLIAPRADFEQRLGRGLSAWVRFDPGLELPTLKDGLFEQDPALPSTTVLASTDSIRLEAGLGASLPGNISLELKGFVRQNENSIFLDEPLKNGLWISSNARGERSDGAGLDESGPLESLLPGLAQRLSFGWQESLLIDSPNLKATFSPALKGEAGLDWAQAKPGKWKASLSLAYLGQRQASLDGSQTLPDYFDLHLGAEYAFNQNLSFLIQARNLLAQRVETFPGYAEPNPFVGAGISWQF
jgi:hypothetical protein